MRGEIVIVRAHNDEPLVRRIWEVKGDVIYITNDEQLERHQSGLPMLWPVGFPSEDVFYFSPDVDHGKGVDWASLKPLSSGGER
jgi:hypothetical protein